MEIDLSHEPEDKILALEPGNEYLLDSHFGTLLDVKWAVWGNGPFEVKIKGVTITSIFPNPFNSDWLPSSSGWVSDRFGIDGSHTVVTFYLVARASASVQIRRTANFTGKGGIKIDF